MREPAKGSPPKHLQPPIALAFRSGLNPVSKSTANTIANAAGGPKLGPHRLPPAAHVRNGVLDLGPEGGDKGGEVVAQGTPEQVAGEAKSYTGGCLQELLTKSIRAEAAARLPKKKRASSASMRQREAAE